MAWCGKAEHNALHDPELLLPQWTLSVNNCNFAVVVVFVEVVVVVQHR